MTFWIGGFSTIVLGDEYAHYWATEDGETHAELIF